MQNQDQEPWCHGDMDWGLQHMQAGDWRLQHHGDSTRDTPARTVWDSDPKHNHVPQSHCATTSQSQFPAGPAKPLTQRKGQNSGDTHILPSPDPEPPSPLITCKKVSMSGNPKKQTSSTLTRSQRPRLGLVYGATVTTCEDSAPALPSPSQHDATSQRIPAPGTAPNPPPRHLPPLLSMNL